MKDGGLQQIHKYKDVRYTHTNRGRKKGHGERWWSTTDTHILNCG